MDLLDRLRELAEEHAVRISEVRADVKADAWARLKKRRRHDDELPDYTAKFLKALRHEIPNSGRVLFLNCPLFGAPGDAKTTTALTIALHVVSWYGEEHVSVYLSDHLPSLVDAMRRRATPVMVLIVDDALRNYSSRGGGSHELLEAIELFTTLRHEFESAANTLDGLVFVLFTSQMYKGVEKVFREGFPIFKSELQSDKEEILASTRMGARAWSYLSWLKREVMIEHRPNRLSDGVVCLPGHDEAGLLHLPPLDTPLLSRLVRTAATDEAGLAAAVGTVAQKYKLLERAWTIPRTRRTKEEELARLNELQDRLAREFAKEREEDVGSAAGAAALRSWLDQRMYGLDVAPERRLASEDYLQLREPGSLQALKAKILQARREQEVEGSEGGLNENDFLDHVSGLLLEAGFKPYSKVDKDRLLSLLYRLPPGLRARALTLKAAILSRAKESVLERAPAQPVHTSTPSPPVPKVSPGTAQFILEPKTLLDDLLQRARTGGDERSFRALLVFEACRFPQPYKGVVLGSPTRIAEEPEGRAWQEAHLGGTYSRPELQKAKSIGERAFANAVGLAYEAWVAAALEGGLMIRGLFDRAPIERVERGGGNGHGPDLVVHYEGGSRDYVSLKCYHQGESISLTTDPRRGADEIAPERRALQADEAQGVAGNRVMVLLRNTYYDGFEGFRYFVASRDIPPSLGFNEADIGSAPWTPITPSRGDGKSLGG